MSEFTDGVTAPEETVTTQSQDQEVDYLAELVGEGKKYSSVEDAARALAKKAVNADKFIEDLKGEKTSLEEKYNELQTRNRSIDEIVEALKQPEPEPVNTVPEQKDTAPSLEEIIAELEKRNQVKAADEARATAIKGVWDTLSTEFGDFDKAKQVVSTYINGDEKKKALVDQMAVSDPQSLLVLLKQKQQQQDVTFSEDMKSKSSENFSSSDGKLTWDIVKQVRKDNPTLYNSKAFKQRMHTEL